MEYNRNTHYIEFDDKNGIGQVFGITKKLHEEQSEFQNIEIYETTKFGNLMIIDDCVMLTSKDNFLYHEIMSHPALLTHNKPEKVAIIGGGDCGTLREVLKHSTVKTATQIDIDERVTRLSEKYFPELCDGNLDPRAEILFADGLKWMKQVEENSLDIIIVDSTDPIGPAVGLFNRAFYKDCLKTLKPDGILVQQSESPLIQFELIKEMREEMSAAGFNNFLTMPFPQPSYPSGWWSATMASKDRLLTEHRSEELKTKYYNSEIHKACIAQPEFFKELS